MRNIGRVNSPLNQGLRDSAIQGVDAFDYACFNRPLPCKLRVEALNSLAIFDISPLGEPNAKQRFKFLITQRVQVLREVRDLVPPITDRRLGFRVAHAKFRRPISDHVDIKHDASILPSFSFVMAILGVPIIRIAQGALADRIGIHLAFVLRAVCYLYIVYYGLRGSRHA